MSLSLDVGAGLGVVTLRKMLPNCACAGATASMQAAIMAGAPHNLCFIEPSLTAPLSGNSRPLSHHFMPFAVIFINNRRNVMLAG